MEGYEFVCDVCSRISHAEVKPRRGDVCFGCHIKTIDLTFKYGKDNFHGPTIKERQDRIVADAKSAGINAVPSSEYGF